jgi:hypothetical protein
MTTKAVVKAASNSLRLAELVTLTATLEGVAAAGWQWDYKAPNEQLFILFGGSESTATHTPQDLGEWTYRATALDADGNRVGESEPGTDTVTVGTAAVAVPGDPSAGPSVNPLVFHSVFAWVSIAVLLVLLVVFVSQSHLWGLAVSLGDEAQKTDPRAALAASVIGPVLTIGAALLLAGLWMVLVEWRAAFRSNTPDKVVTRGGFDSVTDMLKAIVNLKGSSLVFVGGLALLFAVAWMVSSAAGVDTNTSTTPSASASASPSAART